MIKKIGTITTAILFALILTLFFYRQYWGLNILFAELILFALVLNSKQYRFEGKNRIMLGCGLLVSALFTVMAHSAFSYLMNLITLFIFGGILIYPQVRSLGNSILLSCLNLFQAQSRFLKSVRDSRFKGKNIITVIWKSRIFIVPVFIIILFLLLYKNANPVFEQLLFKFSSFCGPWLSAVFEHFDFLIIPVFLCCLFISNFFFTRVVNEAIVQKDKNAAEEMERIRVKQRDSFNIMALKNEYRAGVFLFLVLNLLLLIVNTIDVYWVWFHFKWEGQYLKQFVHEGTYLLIAALIISVLLVLYFFRDNLNFYRKNTILKNLSMLWLLQNAVLAISVAVRNFRYIEYFALAYKRIGVIIFLVLVIYGLYSVYMKIRKTKTTFYLIRTNLYAFYLVLTVASFVNWDRLIAAYNFSHYKQSFLHLDYMATLSYQALPLLDRPLEELQRIEAVQREKFPFDGKGMKVDHYQGIITYHKKQFFAIWESKSILSWNLPEYLAYRELKEKQEN